MSWQGHKPAFQRVIIVNISSLLDDTALRGFGRIMRGSRSVIRERTILMKKNPILPTSLNGLSASTNSGLIAAGKQKTDGERPSSSHYHSSCIKRDIITYGDTIQCESSSTFFPVLLVRDPLCNNRRRSNTTIHHHGIRGGVATTTNSDVVPCRETALSETLVTELAAILPVQGCHTLRLAATVLDGRVQPVNATTLDVVLRP